jgi:biotin transport system substrate-specific component
MFLGGIMSLSITNSKVIQFARPVIGFFLLLFCAQVQIPLSPVPITLQTVALLIIGLTFSKKDALQSVGAYLALGALGFPVFAGFSFGIAKFFGATGGFLFGFLASVWVMTTLREKLTANSFWNMLLVAFAGQATLYICGIAWLSFMIDFKWALAVGLYPFIVPGFVKAFLVAAAVKSIKK